MILITMWTAFSQGDSSKIRWLEKVEAPDTRGAQEPAFNLREHPEIKNKLPSAKSGKSKILILAYTNFFIFEKWIKEDADECSLGQRKQCVLDKFEVTYDIERFMESDLVLFHARNMPMLFYLYFLSRTRPSFQRWVYVSWESPDATPDPEPLNSLFNLTWTYRSDADLWCPYGSYERLSPRDAKNYVKKTALTADFAKGKSKLVAWLVSNCESSLMRTSVVNELRNYIEVDVFGNCSTEFGQDRSCSNAVECLKDYKFYLSFENALCEDYITEKYWGRLGKICFADSFVNLFISRLLACVILLPFADTLVKQSVRNSSWRLMGIILVSGEFKRVFFKAALSRTVRLQAVSRHIEKQ